MLPTLHHSELVILYHHDFSMPKEELEMLMALPRESLLQDFTSILDDARNNFEYYEKRASAAYNLELMAPIHVFLLAGGLEAIEIFDELHAFLIQDDRKLDFWFGDFLTEFIPNIIYKIAHKNIDLLIPHIRKTAINPYIRSAYTSAISLTGYFFVERKAKVISFLQDTARYLIDLRQGKEGWNRDNELLNIMLIDALGMGFEELVPLAREALEKDLIDDVYSSEEEIEEIIQDTLNFKGALKIDSIFEEYERAQHLFEGDSIEEDLFLPEGKDDWDTSTKYQNEPFQYSYQEPIKRDSPKIGRNDPCPCGSGKKYKKCCGKK